MNNENATLNATHKPNPLWVGRDGDFIRVGTSPRRKDVVLTIERSKLPSKVHYEQRGSVLPTWSGDWLLRHVVIREVTPGEHPKAQKLTRDTDGAYSFEGSAAKFCSVGFEHYTGVLLSPGESTRVLVSLEP